MVTITATETVAADELPSEPATIEVTVEVVDVEEARRDYLQIPARVVRRTLILG